MATRLDSVRSQVSQQARADLQPRRAELVRPQARAPDAFTPADARARLRADWAPAPAPVRARGLGFEALEVDPRAGGPSTTDPVTGVTIAPGVERWPVKTAVDPGVSAVNTTPVTTTVSALNDIPAPPTTQSSVRIAPTEDTVYQIQAHIIGVKEEKDGDIHLILSDDSAGTRTMDAEVPYPPFANGSPFQAQIQAARDAVNANIKVTGSMQKLDIPVTISGIGFFDRLHGQTGAAANGIELHPVLSVDFSAVPPPPPPPTPPPAPGEVKGMATPNQRFTAGGSVSSTIHLDGALDLQTLKLGVNASHRDLHGLQVTLQSPSGRTFTLPDPSKKIVNGTFDVSSAFAGEPVAGDWTLTVSSSNGRDTGKLANWSLDALGPADPGPTPPGKEIPPRKDGPVDPALPNRPEGPQHGPIIHYERWVTGGLARGDQPTAGDLARLQRDGIKTIVNLRSEDNSDEATAKQLGLNYVHLPWVDGAVPTEDGVKQFLDVATDPANGPTFVHCLAGHNRTGIAVACYEMAVEGMTADQAIAEGETFGLHLPNQEAFIRQFGADLAAGKIAGYPLASSSPTALAGARELAA